MVYTVPFSWALRLGKFELGKEAHPDLHGTSRRLAKEEDPKGVGAI